jgi:hypothetical protein
LSTPAPRRASRHGAGSRRAARALMSSSTPLDCASAYGLVESRCSRDCEVDHNVVLLILARHCDHFCHAATSPMTVYGLRTSIRSAVYVKPRVGRQRRLRREQALKRTKPGRLLSDERASSRTTDRVDQRERATSTGVA